jgi:putative tryptophan/tyrosine transport system substrate-binding protein
MVAPASGGGQNRENLAESLGLTIPLPLLGRADEVIDLAERFRVPAIYGSGSGGAKAGGLMSHSLDVPAQVRQIAPYFDRILRGEKPADLPVHQPTQFQYLINLKTAKALELDVPLMMQMTADELIE